MASHRGRGSYRYRSRGSVRHAASGRQSNTFRISRVKENDQQSDESISRSAQFEEDSSAPDLEEVISDGELSSDSEDDHAEMHTVRSYNTLLQSLNAESNREAPRKKRRKLGHQGSINGSDSIENHSGLQGNSTELTLSRSGDVDRVEEPEEGPNVDVEELEGEIEGDDDASDPFEIHFANPDDNLLSRRLKSISGRRWKALKESYGTSNLILSIPEDSSLEYKTIGAATSTKGFKLKQKLSEPARKLMPGFGPSDGIIASAVFNYHDILFSARSVENGELIRQITCLHAVNHIFKTRDRVIKNNTKLSRENLNEDVELRDQGFTRPKVLMLLPTRNACVQAVKTICDLCEPEQQENRKRFQDSFVEEDDKFSSEKPNDFRGLFAGNDDDMFRLGMKFTRKTIKYFSQFYNSDIIFASPLGLRMAISPEDSKKQDYDFLSSIEIVIMDRADALLMQNWEHVAFIFEHLNLQPKEAHGCDFSRVRNWYLDGNSKYLRQTIVLSAFNTPELNSLFSNHMLNAFGRAKISQKCEGVIVDLNLRVKQTFSRFEASSPSADPDARFKYFTAAILPSLTRQVKAGSGGQQAGILLYVPSYLDFVRLRNFFANSISTQDISFGSISEYSSVREAARARSHFLSGRHSLLLYTERAHHFRRYIIRGVKKVIMYGLPENPLFYQEIAGGYLNLSVQEGKIDEDNGNVRVAFSKWDSLKLERIVGTKRVRSLLGDKRGDTFDFV